MSIEGEALKQNTKEDLPQAAKPGQLRSNVKTQDIKNQEKMRALSWVAGVDAKSSCQGGKMTVSAKRGDAGCAEESAEFLWVGEEVI